jgi:uncharacterized protein
MKNIAVGFINIYQIVISTTIKNLLGVSGQCRFDETCSAYTKRAIMESGLIRGISRGFVRILKCQPFYN